MQRNHLLTKISIKADATGNAPGEIELLRAGKWETPYHGDFELTEADLHEFAANFAKGTGLVEGDKKAPINYAHESWQKAAAWISKLRVSEDGQKLIGSVEWTPNGAQALKDGEWRYISPEFNPRGCPWFDSEGSDDGEINYVVNVLTGAALTNIPLFKKLKPIMASRIPPKKVIASAAGDGDKNNQGEPMDLKEIRTKQVADLTEAEKTFLSENKADLTADELKTFGLEEAPAVTPETPETPEPPVTPTVETPAATIEASAIKGITDAELTQLRADAAAGREAQQKLAKNEASSFIAASVKAGQIKSGEADKAVKILLASSGAQRTELEAFIKGLPKNEDLGKELGDGGSDVTAAGARTELIDRVNASVRSAWDNDRKVVAASAAREQILKSDPALAARIKEEEEN